MYIHTYVRRNEYVCMYIKMVHICMYVCMYTYLHTICMSTLLHTCTYMFKYTCLYVVMTRYILYSIIMYKCVRSTNVVYQVPTYQGIH